MYRDVSAWRYAQFARMLPVRRIGIGNVQRAMTLALGIPAVDHVNAFGCTVSRLACFGPTGSPPSAIL